MTNVTVNSNGFDLNQLVHFQTINNLNSFAREIAIDSIKFDDNGTLEETIAVICDVVMDTVKMDCDNIFDKASNILDLPIADDYFGKLFEKPIDYNFKIEINKGEIETAIEDFNQGLPLEDINLVCHLELNVNFAEKDLILLTLADKLTDVVYSIYNKVGTEWLSINGKNYDYYM